MIKGMLVEKSRVGKDSCISLLLFALSGLICFLLRALEKDKQLASMLIGMMVVLIVHLVARLTSGYLYGIVISLFATFLVNYFFIYPYYVFDVSISGYPLSFAVMLTVGLITSTLTTQQKNQERVKREMEQEKLRGNLLRAVSHDLRTPLTSIVGHTSVILENDGKLDREKELKLLAETKEDAQWLIRIVENLLAITRMNAGETKIKKELEMVEEVVAETIRKFRTHFPEQQVIVQVPEEPVLVPMDALLIEQVINNILQNAVQHSGDNGPIEFTVSIGDAPDKKNSSSGKHSCVYFLIRDHGEGLADKMLQAFHDGRFSEEIQQGDYNKNLGIGLSLCRSIVYAHGGETVMQNAEGGGAIFGFWLPDIQIESVEA